MADLGLLRAFARLNLTRLTWPLTHEEVRILAADWMPEMRFDPDENFHPISFGELLKLRSGNVRREDYLKTVSGSQPSRSTTTKPPVFFQSEARKVPLDPAAGDITSASYMSNVIEVGERISRFDSRDRSPWGMAIQYFGSTSSNGIKIPASPVTAIAEYRDLRAFLALRVKAERAAESLQLPRDAEGVLLDAVLGPFWLALSDDSHKKSRQLGWLEGLLEMADKADLGDARAKSREATILDELVADGVFRVADWKVIRDYALLEYFFVYAYNDITKHHTLSIGDHEGDIEGLGVLFNRHRVAQIEQSADRLDYLRNVLRPRFLVSAPHRQWQGLDHHVDLAADPQLAQLSQGDFKTAAMRAWVMAGSHANYLRPGTYQNFNSVDEEVEAGSAVLAALAVPAYAVPAAALVVLLEHFLNPEETTSDAGAHSTPPWSAGQPTGGAAAVGSRVRTTPLSADRNIYQDTWQPGDAAEIDITLAERVFAGTWGFQVARSYSNVQRFTQNVAESFM